MTYRDCPVCGKLPCVLGLERRQAIVDAVKERRSMRLQRLLQLEDWADLAPGYCCASQEAAEQSIKHALLRLECWHRHIADALREK